MFRDLNQGLAAAKEFLRRHEALRQDSFEVSILGVADGEPTDLGRRTELLEQADEIAVFGQYDAVCLPSSAENLANSAMTSLLCTHNPV